MDMSGSPDTDVAPAMSGHGRCDIQRHDIDCRESIDDSSGPFEV
jgi:hypothetical protein